MLSAGVISVRLDCFALNKSDFIINMYSEEEQNNQWSNDPDNWVWGIFYYNKNDKRLLLPKRNPAFGITVNFANPKTYLFIAALILLIGILKRI